MNRLPLQFQPTWKRQNGLWFPETLNAGKVQRDPATGKYNQDPATHRELCNTDTNNKCCCTGAPSSGDTGGPGGCGCDGPMPLQITVTLNVPIMTGCPEGVARPQCGLCQGPRDPATGKFINCKYPGDLDYQTGGGGTFQFGAGTAVLSPQGRMLKSFCLQPWNGDPTLPFSFDSNCPENCIFFLKEKPAASLLLASYDVFSDAFLYPLCGPPGTIYVNACDDCVYSGPFVDPVFWIVVYYSCANTFWDNPPDPCRVACFAGFGDSSGISRNPLFFGNGSLSDCKCTSSIIIDNLCNSTCIVDGGKNVPCVGDGGTAIITAGC